MKITPITRENLKYYKGFISAADVTFIEEGYRLLPLGLVADDLEGTGPMAAGALCIRPDEYELRISSLYVSPAYRGRGAGRFLLDEAGRLFGGEDTELDIEFLIYGEEEERLAQFLEHCGFTFADPEYDVYMVTADEIRQTSLYGKSGKGIPFSSIDPDTFRHIQRTVEKRLLPAPSGGLGAPGIDRDVSVMLAADYYPEAYTVVEKLTDRTLLLSSVYVNDSRPAMLLALLTRTAALFTGKYPGDTRLLIQTVEEQGEKVIGQIFDDAESISCRYRLAL